MDQVRELRKKEHALRTAARKHVESAAREAPSLHLSAALAAMDEAHKVVQKRHKRLFERQGRIKPDKFVGLLEYCVVEKKPVSIGNHALSTDELRALLDAYDAQVNA